jgi:hypothetical protein
VSTVDALEALGAIPSVYSLLFPETRVAFEELRHAPGLEQMYERAWTKRQDPLHHELLDRWMEWARPVLGPDVARFEHRYVAAGSSEAIRDSVAQHAATSFAFRRAPRVHVFAGEYEGYGAYARAHHCEVVVHDRDTYEDSLTRRSRPGERFYLSAPSSIDGMLWPAYDDFLRFVSDRLPDMRVAVDLCYLGCVGSGAYEISIDAPAVDTVFFSLSKVFGVYYHRIGGALSTAPAPGLAGNVWFKNLLSIRLGVQLLERHGVFELAQRYRAQQEAVCERLREACGEGVRPSDVLLLAHQPAGDDSELDAHFARGTSTRRYCLTPALDAAIAESTR